MSSLLDILAIAARGDVRSDVLKELERQLALLNEFQAKPGVDGGRLRAIMSNLMRLRADLMSSGVGFLQPLRDSEFLNSIKHRSAIPGGTCEFDLPDYFFWLSRPPEERLRTFNQWLALLRPMCDSIAELLWLTRQNGLLRISLPAEAGLFPEISGSHYRCSVRFLTWNGLGTRPTQADRDVPFLLSCCS
jgi:cell division protein ZapD